MIKLETRWWKLLWVRFMRKPKPIHKGERTTWEDGHFVTRWTEGAEDRK